MVIGKTKGMAAMEPSMVGITPGGGPMQNGITHDF